MMAATTNESAASTAEDILATARGRNQKALSEYDAKRVLRRYGIPVTREQRCRSDREAVAAAEAIGGPVALKPCSPEILHKSETGCIHLNLSDLSQVQRAFDAIRQQLGPTDILVQEMVPGSREILIGMTRDDQFGPCVLLGVGGVLAEVIDDTVFRAAPFETREAADMLDQLRSQKIFQAFRSQRPTDRDALCRILVAVGRIGDENPSIREIDINPLIISPDGLPVAADALMVLSE
jgi:succinyl-CoA synthetase beta subunit